MHCYRKSLACPKAAHFSLRRASPRPSPHGRVIALLLCKLCNPNFLIFALILVLFVFYFEWSAITAPLFVPNLRCMKAFDPLGSGLRCGGSQGLPVH